MVRAHGLTGVPVRVDHGQHGHQIPSDGGSPASNGTASSARPTLCREFRPGAGSTHGGTVQARSAAPRDLTDDADVLPPTVGADALA